MKIIETRVYTGRNIYSHKLCVRFTVDVEDKADTPTKDIKGFNKKLVNALPGLKKHKCSLGFEGGFLERLEEGTYLPHVFEHMLIEMQNLLGFTEVRYGKARCVKGSIYHVICQYELKEAALLCAEYALNCVNAFIEDKEFDLNDAIGNIERQIVNIRLGPSTKGIYDEAVKRGIPVIRLGNESMLQLGYGKKQKRIEATLTENTSCIAVDISCDKSLTREVLKSACLPVADGECVENIDEVLISCRKIGYPVVIKPMYGSKGSGVTVGVKDDKSAIEAYKIASKINRKVLIERYIEGRDYRVLVVGKKVIAVSLRIPPYVTGDGESNILELIEKENENPKRGYDHEKPLTKIPIDDITINYLKNKGLSLCHVPKKGERITLRFNANISTGGVAKDCTDIIHPDNIEIAIRAAEAVGLDVAGIDICTKDISKSMKTNSGAILEVNAAPGIRMHMYPSLGKGRDVPSYILDYLFPSKSEYSIPVISVTGTNGKTTTTRLIAHIMSLKGLCVGMTTTSGIYINDKCIIKGDTTGPDSAKTILMDKRVDIAVLETARGGIVRRGLGYDLADVGVITNISEDHLGIDGINTMEELADVKSLVVEAVKDYGYAVLNADDESVNLLSQRVKCNIIYFSKSEDNLILKKHIMDGGIGIFIRDNFICLADAERVEPIIDICQIPSTYNGKLQYNVENSMAAVAACIGLRVDVETIAKGLKTFYLDAAQNPGRFNVYNVDNFKVVVDYGHNIGGYTAVIESLKKMEFNRLVGVIGVPGDRTDSSIIEVGGICGKGFDYIYIKEDADKRGRKEGEVAALLEMGILSAHKEKENYKVILSETEALKTALENAKDGDCIAVFYEDYDGIIKIINDFKDNKGAIKEKLDVV
ncbi:cyanophycin synthetase [Fervidicella metallireducens AeB]|uniref:Cyanophycin synthetase n=1 Tax=Fervidicella metallireducens AeB TaxID=1403537 RepID=A0A017RZF2_9CLOT|nr:cyanophycin synthetase [Fervidicella metallireducens]EYE89784.1 cyanophycin synthetase [Fervidicella metallireducens AeB]